MRSLGLFRVLGGRFWGVFSRFMYFVVLVVLEVVGESGFYEKGEENGGGESGGGSGCGVVVEWFSGGGGVLSFGGRFGGILGGISGCFRGCLRTSCVCGSDGLHLPLTSPLGVGWLRLKRSQEKDRFRFPEKFVRSRPRTSQGRCSRRNDTVAGLPIAEQRVLTSGGGLR